MRTWGAAVLVGVLVVTAAATSAVAPAAAAPAQDCRDVVLVAAEGTGDVVGAVAGPLRERAGERLRVVDVPPAAAGTSYAAAQQEALGALSSSVNGIAAACPQSRFLLVGHSRGAHAAGDLASRIGTGQERGIAPERVLAVGLFGDPARSPFTRVVPPGTGGQGVLPVRAAGFGALEGRTIEVCAAGDPVCDSPARTAFPSVEEALRAPAHGSYAQLPVTRSLTATQWAADSLGRLVESVPATPPAPAAPAAPGPSTTRAPEPSGRPGAVPADPVASTGTTTAAPSRTTTPAPSGTTTPAPSRTTTPPSGRATPPSGRTAAPSSGSTTTSSPRPTSSPRATTAAPARPSTTAPPTTAPSTTAPTTTRSGEAAGDTVFSLAGVTGFDLGQGGNVEDGEVPEAVASPNVPDREAVKLAVPAGGRRSEVRPDDAAQDIRPGDRLFFGWSAFLPDDFPVDADDFQVVWQLHDGETNTSPPVALEVQRGRLWLANVGDLVEDLGPIRAGENVAVHLDIDFAIGAGSVTLWRDGQQRLTGFRPPKGTMIDGSNYLKVGLYRDGEGAPASSIFLNDLKIGESLDAVSALAGATGPPPRAVP